VSSQADLAILVPMLGRPHRVAPLLESIRETTPGARVLFLVTTGDQPVIDALDGADRVELPPRQRGDYAVKINAGYRHTTEPLLFLAADDLRFHPGWFELAAAKLTPGIGVVGTNDLCNRRTMRGEHSTHSLVTREYVDRFGTIDEPGKVLHEGYVHEFVDDELVGTARKRRAYAHASKAIVEHLHPMNGQAPMDRLYRRQGMRMRASRDLYQRRRMLWT
jgi:hypothetical protein